MLGFDTACWIECMAKWTHKTCWVGTESDLFAASRNTESLSVNRKMIGTVANARWHHPP